METGKSSQIYLHHHEERQARDTIRVAEVWLTRSPGVIYLQTSLKKNWPVEASLSWFPFLGLAFLSPLPSKPHTINQFQSFPLSLPLLSSLLSYFPPLLPPTWTLRGTFFIFLSPSNSSSTQLPVVSQQTSDHAVLFLIPILSSHCLKKV